MAVGEDQRRPVIGLGFAEGLQRVLRISAHRDLRDIDVAISDGLQRHVLARRALARGRELRNGAERGGFRSLATGVGIDLGIQHQHVHVARRGEDVVQSAEADVVCPAVAADDPDAAADKVVHNGQQIERRRFLHAQKPCLQLRHPKALGADIRLFDLRRLGDSLGQFRPHFVGKRYQ